MGCPGTGFSGAAPVGVRPVVTHNQFAKLTPEKDESEDDTPWLGELSALAAAAALPGDFCFGLPCSSKCLRSCENLHSLPREHSLPAALPLQSLSGNRTLLPPAAPAFALAFAFALGSAGLPLPLALPLATELS